MGIWRVVPTILFFLGAVGHQSVAAQASSDSRDRDRGVVLRGTVVDQVSEEVLPTADVSLGPADSEGALIWEGRSGPEGEFRTPRLSMGLYEMEVRLPGFVPITHLLLFSTDGTAELRIEMVPVAFELEPVVATAVRQSRLEQHGFFERRSVGIGYTLTRTEIESRGPSRVSDLFYGVPGARVVANAARTGRQADIRLRSGCIPQLVLDGNPLAAPIAIDALLSVHELEALEVYHGSGGPVQGLRYNTCGTVMAWTREVSSMDPASEFGWRKWIAAAALVGFFVVTGPY